MGRSMLRITALTEPTVFRSLFLLLSRMAASGWPGGVGQAAQAPSTQEGEDSGGGASGFCLLKAPGAEPDVAYFSSAPLRVSLGN